MPLEQIIGYFFVRTYNKQQIINFLVSICWGFAVYTTEKEEEMQSGIERKTICENNVEDTGKSHYFECGNKFTFLNTQLPFK